MQIDGYSLDAQRTAIKDFADKENMVIVGEYVDAGKSGKNIAGRPQFIQMMEDIQSGKDGISYVLVFKLSRFGRNAADIMNSVQTLEDNGVYLHSIEDYLDTGKGVASKLLISILSSVAELERENIRVQTLAGREQKAREGKWNGGFAPYGYKLVNGNLEIADDEKDVILKIFELYTTGNMGATGVAKYLNSNGYIKKKRQNGTLEAFSATFVKKVIENPVYCGQIAYGRRKTEKIKGARNEFHIVKQETFPIYQGIHEPIVSEDLWNSANIKRKNNAVKREKVHSLEHEHILSGVLKCPQCGSPMYGNVSRKKKADGTQYKDIWFYQCKRRKVYNGQLCDFRKNINQEVINAAVEEVISNLVKNPQFAELISQELNTKVDVSSINKEIEEHEKRRRKYILVKEKLSSQIDNLDVDDKTFEMKYEDLQRRLDGAYEDIASENDEIEVLKGRKKIIQEEKMAFDSVYTILIGFDKYYKRFTDLEKKEFMNATVSEIQIYPEKQPNGQWLKSITFKFPVLFNGSPTYEVDMSGLDGIKTVETVALLSKIQNLPYTEVTLNLSELDLTSSEAKATYGEISRYIQEKYGFKVSNLYVAQIKRKYGIIERANYNFPKTDNPRVPRCPKEKEDAIVDALKHFKMI